MDRDPLEQHLQRQPPRQIPPEWRDEILSAARAVSADGQASPIARYTLNIQLLAALRALLWPSPVAWAGLAAIWLFLLGMNFSMRTARPDTAPYRSTAPELILAWKEQARLLTELVGPAEPLLAERPKPVAPRPRSEREQSLRVV